ncbi:hypothetical protein [Pseudomonas sp. W03]|uniref:hypothetical protein n=1 Tax=Pseudomonas sp. W03 TaxID=3090666 RepID=UPI003A4D63A5
MIEERDIFEFIGARLTGVVVGVGSFVLVFDNEVSITIQCPFEVDNGEVATLGHGEELNTCNLLFVVLNMVVKDAGSFGGNNLLLKFESADLKIFSSGDGLESFVISNRFGILPVY